MSSVVLHGPSNTTWLGFMPARLASSMSMAPEISAPQPMLASVLSTMLSKFDFTE
jgi:hypothetical protein